jgi:hypothetical protein
MLRAYWDRLSGPQSPSPLARGGPPRGQASPRPGPDALVPAARQIPSAHHASHQRPIEPPGQGPRPGPCRVARCQEATVPSHHCHFAAPPLTRRPHNRAPGKVERASPRPRAVAPAMPCHPPHRPSRTSPIQTHRPSLASNRARKRSAVPTRFSGAHNHTHKVGLRRPAGQVLPSPPSLPTGETRGGGGNWRRSPGAPSPWDHDAPGPSRSGLGQPPPAQAIRSPPMLPTGKGQGTLEPHPGTSKGPGTYDSYYLDLTLSGQGPRPAHPANWRRVFDVERRPSSTRDARGRSLGVGPPPSARRCRGTLMGRCVLHKSSQGSG